MHDGGSFAEVGAEAHAGGVGDAHARRHHVVGHFRKLVNAADFQRVTAQAGGELPGRQLADVNGTLAGPGDVGQYRKQPLQVGAVRHDQPVR